VIVADRQVGLDFHLYNIWFKYIAFAFEQFDQAGTYQAFSLRDRFDGAPP